MSDTPLEPVIVTRPEDLDGFEPGIPYIVEVPNPPEDPEEYAERFLPVDAAIQARMRERFRPEKPETPGPADPDRGRSEERLVQPVPAALTETISVKFTETHAVITSTVDQEVELSGDIRDGTANLTAGKASRRKLTGEGNGWVSVNGQRWEY